VAEGVDIMHRLEIARLDALQAAVWDNALAGDTAAVTGVLRIIEQRSKLLGLGRQLQGPTRKGVPEAVVVPEPSKS
jgi:hypothetical protein